jgi:hypothetical protein
MTKPEVVLEFLKHFCNADIDSVAALLTADLRFSGPFYQFDSRRAYIESLKSNPPERCGYKVRSLTEGDNEVSVFYDYEKGTQSVTIAQLCRFKDQKISEIVLVFDGRALV